MDREKVISTFEKIISVCKEDGCDFVDLTFEDAEQILALLKEREEELSYREAKAITHTATKLDDETCPSCGNVVGKKIRTGAIGQSVVQVRWNYCRFCGQKLDWEGR